MLHMMRAVTLRVVLVAVSVSLPASLAAQGSGVATYKSMPLEDLGNIIVTSVSKEPAEISQTPAAIYVLTHDDLARSGATSVADALRLVPGVEVARIDTSRNWVVGIRGFGDQFSKSVLVLIDGRTAYTPLWAGVHWPIQDTLLEDVERIEVIRGPGGTIWGANAENGVINIITRKASDTHGIYASAATGTVEHAIAGVRVGGGNGRGLDYRAYIKGINRAPQFHTDGREFDTWASGQAGMRIDWTRGRDQLTVQGDAYKSKLGESVEVSTYAPPARFLVDDPVDLSGANVVAKWHRTLPNRADVTVRSYVDHTYRLGTDFGERRTTIDVDAVHHWFPAPRHEMVWGAGARTSPSKIIQTYSFSNFDPHEETLNIFSAFAQDAATLVEKRLVATVGVKLEHNSYTGAEVQPSARVMWTPSDNATVWGGVTRAVRVPSRVDEDITVESLFQVTPSVIYGAIVGNRELESERVLGTEVGYRALLRPALYLDVAAFHNDYDNIVDLGKPESRTQTTDGLTYLAVRFPWTNSISGTTRGFEVAPKWQPADRLELRGSYSFIDLQLPPTPPPSTPSTLPTLKATPSHQVVGQAMITLPHGLQVDPVYRYVSSRASQNIPPYHTADVRVAFDMGKGLALAVSGQNLLQAHHAEWLRAPGPAVEIKRSVYVRLIWKR